MLRASLKVTGLKKEAVEKLLTLSKIEPTRRPQSLEFGEWKRLAENYQLATIN
jgi:hypothetical protein